MFSIQALTTSQDNLNTLRMRDIPWLPALACALTLYRAHIPGGSILQDVGLFFWLLYLIVGLIRFERNNTKAGCLKNDWKFAIVYSLAIISIVGSQVAMPICFWLSKPAFEDYIRAHANDKDSKQVSQSLKVSNHPSIQIGLYPIYAREYSRTGEIFFVTTVRNGNMPAYRVHGFEYISTKPGKSVGLIQPSVIEISECYRFPHWFTFASKTVPVEPPKNLTDCF